MTFFWSLNSDNKWNAGLHVNASSLKVWAVMRPKAHQYKQIYLHLNNAPSSIESRKTKT